MGSNCLLEVGGKLVFSGTLEGEAPGVTRALVFASCPEVGSSPPGTFPDIFKSKLSFSGTVNGLPATADIVYKGKTEVGGNIKALMHLSNGLKGKLKVDAVVAVGGTYAGLIKDN